MTAPAEDGFAGWKLMVARIVTVQLLAATVMLGVTALGPSLREEFGLSRASTGSLVTAAFLGVVVASWPAGRATDRWGTRTGLMVSCVGLGAGFAALALAPGFTAVLAILSVVGLFYALITPGTNAAVIAWAAAPFRTRSMALKQMGVSAGAAASAVLIPLLGDRFGWRVAVIVVGGAVAVLGIVVAGGVRVPVAGHERGRAGAPSRHVIALGIVSLLLLVVQYSVSIHFILAVHEAGLTLVASGGVLGLLQVAATAGRYGWAWIADRFMGGDAGGALTISAMTSCVVMAIMSPLGLIETPVLAAVLLGVTSQASNGLLQVVLADAGGSRPGTSSGVGMALGFCGAVVGPPLFGFAADRWGYEDSWILLAIVSLAAAVLARRSSRIKLTPAGPAAPVHR